MLGAQEILLADDDQDARELFARWLRSDGYSVRTVSDGLACLREFAARGPDLVVIDLKMPPGDWGGFDTLRKLREADSTVPVIVVSNKADIRRAVDCVRAGAFDFVDKSAAAEELLVAVANALRLRELEHKARVLEEETRLMRRDAEAEFAGHRIVAQSEAMRDLLSLVRRVAPTDATVMVRGETGTGKELVATAVHYLSAKRDGPFIRVNCAALPLACSKTSCSDRRRGVHRNCAGGKGVLSWTGRSFSTRSGSPGHGAQAEISMIARLQFERAIRGPGRSRIVVQGWSRRRTGPSETIIPRGEFRRTLVAACSHHLLIHRPQGTAVRDIPAASRGAARGSEAPTGRPGDSRASDRSLIRRRPAPATIRPSAGPFPRRRRCRRTRTSRVGAICPLGAESVRCRATGCMNPFSIRHKPSNAAAGLWPRDGGNNGQQAI